MAMKIIDEAFHFRLLARDDSPRHGDMALARHYHAITAR